MSSIKCYAGASAVTPPSGVVVLYAKTDGRWYFKADDGTEYAMRPEGAGTGDLKADGTVPLTADWDMGDFSVTMKTLTLDVAQGTAPLTVTSTTLVANLNADLLDGNEATAFAQSSALGTAAAEDVGYFATAAQGSTADTAVQPGALGTAAAEDVGYFATAAQGTTADGAVQKATFDANTILAADTDDTPAALTVPEQTLVGRITAGNIDALTVTEVKTLLGISNSALNKVITGTTYTILAADDGYNLIFTNAAAIAVTVPDTLDTDFQCAIVQTTAAGIPTATRSGTDTINGAATGVAPADQWKAMYLTQYAAGTWWAAF